MSSLSAEYTLENAFEVSPYRAAILSPSSLRE